ncbi:MAG: hypothetical protein HN392_01755 [Anaerolineae bacterium]|jgi:hypothetical protein|nr:hypothetical protein [Anaerolineae bacterium]MBT7075405.1 hypothetical protein [Anaerolineae bacterium]MBT7781423.1 hypothetical protein [Anaerolineae bacterium]
MKKNKKIIAFGLLIIGTLGLLLNEFLFGWGRSATLLLTTANIIGLLILGFSYKDRN